MNTISAISTPIGQGGIGIVRISGEKSLEIIQKIFKSKAFQAVPNTIVYGKIHDNGEILDEVLVSYFKAPNSFTGEDTIEINSHGGAFIVQRILELTLKNGATLATPGEFTKRAFLNGKLDLSQAEAVIDLINSKTKIENDASMKQLEGELGKKIRKIKDEIVDILVYLEANVDYPEYDIEVVSRNKVRETIEKAISDLNSLSESYAEGNIIKNGINVAIVGKPNVGKSSLLNRFLNEERAIVTEIAGTTRDTIEESIVHKGLVINFIDTAGIHTTDDLVENIGIKKSLSKIEEADFVLMVLDNSTKLSSDDIDLLKNISDKNKIIVVNKTDVNTSVDEELLKYCSNDEIQLTSAKENKGIDEILDKITSKYIKNEFEKKSDLIITNQRHKEAIDKALYSFNNILRACNEGIPLDMVSIDMQNGVSYLCEILGENISEDIINGIFKKFCLGK